MLTFKTMGEMQQVLYKVELYILFVCLLFKTSWLMEIWQITFYRGWQQVSFNKRDTMVMFTAI